VTAKTARERIHQLIDQLTEEQAEALELEIKLALLPVDDEPLTDEEIEAIEESRQEIERGETISSDEAKRQLLQ
jgi:hypothetical protein